MAANDRDAMDEAFRSQILRRDSEILRMSTEDLLLETRVTQSSYPDCWKLYSTRFDCYSQLWEVPSQLGDALPDVFSMPSMSVRELGFEEMRAALHNCAQWGSNLLGYHFRSEESKLLFGNIRLNTFVEFALAVYNFY